MKKKKGFTLIELLAVIIILAVIALIAVPQVLKILNKSRLAAAEDSVYGVVGATENYIGNLMLKNNGSYPKDDIEFECNGSCKLSDEVKTKLQNYDLTGLEELNFKGSNPNGGRVIITNGGKTTIVKNLEINGFICSYPIGGKAKCVKIGEELEEPDIPEPPKPEIINITLTFNAMGGSVSPTSIEVTYNEKYGELATPTRTGYIFGGWYTLPTCLEANKITSESIVKTIENQTLYAKWTEEVCNNTIKSVTCTKTCFVGTETGTRTDIYDGYTGDLISTGTCNASFGNISGRCELYANNYAQS